MSRLRRRQAFLFYLKGSEKKPEKLGMASESSISQQEGHLHSFKRDWSAHLSHPSWVFRNAKGISVRHTQPAEEETSECWPRFARSICIAARAGRPLSMTQGNWEPISLRMGIGCLESCWCWSWVRIIPGWGNRLVWHPLLSSSSGERAYLPLPYNWFIAGNENFLHYSCLENSMDRGAWWAPGFAKNWTHLKPLSTHTQSVYIKSTGPVISLKCISNPSVISQ